LFGEGADDLVGGAFKDFDDAAGDVFLVARVVFFADDDFGDDEIAGDGVEIVAGGDEEIAVGVWFIGNDEAEAAARLAESPGHSITECGQADHAPRSIDDAARRRQCVDLPLEFPPILRRDVQSLREIRHANGLAVLGAQIIDDRFVILLCQNAAP